MSNGARISIAVVCVAAAVAFAWWAVNPAGTPSKAWVSWLLAAFCLVVAITCIPGRHVAVTGRLIGGVIFAAYVGYIVSEIVSPTPHQSRGFIRDSFLARSQSSLPNAIKGFLVWGLPSGYVMIFGWPRPWTKRCFGSSEDDGSDEPDDDDEPEIDR